MPNEPRASRRSFLKHSAATLAGGLLVGRDAARVGHAATERTAAEIVAGKDPRLIVHGAEAIELETPLRFLAEYVVTPKSLLYVRNNQQLAGTDNLDPVAMKDWSIEIAGLVDKPASIRVADLSRMDHVEHELVLQCSGNGRAYFSKLAPAKGAQWHSGAMGNVRFAGVPLTAVLDRLKVGHDSAARFVTATGRDTPIKAGDADFEHSIPLDDALARSFIALSMNGEPIPAVHGGPVRLVTPGYYATMNVKWLTQLRFDAQETPNYHQVARYRTPKEPIPVGSDFKYGLANSDANWRMRIKSVIFSPLDNEVVRAGRTEVRGVAWNDGAAKIETVLVTTGPQRPWQQATLAPGAGPYAWQPWSVSLDLPRGEHQIAVRAIDALGRSQPFSAAAQWNPAGYCFSAVHVVNVVVS
ncbi:MAG TPA: sulfite oxidase [Pirellulales bacterium]|nr:sulfite oxidase [Pirellulales bacterium]